MIRTNVLARLPRSFSVPYDFVSNFLVSMGSLPERPGETNPANQFGLGSMMGKAFRKCTIF